MIPIFSIILNSCSYFFKTNIHWKKQKDVIKTYNTCLQRKRGNYNSKQNIILLLYNTRDLQKILKERNSKFVKP